MYLGQEDVLEDLTCFLMLCAATRQGSGQSAHEARNVSSAGIAACLGRVSPAAQRDVKPPYALREKQLT